jgi:hypothetical protein
MHLLMMVILDSAPSVMCWLAVDNFIMMDQGAALVAIGSRSVMIYSTTFVWMARWLSPHLISYENRGPPLSLALS